MNTDRIINFEEEQRSESTTATLLAAIIKNSIELCQADDTKKFYFNYDSENLSLNIHKTSKSED